MREIEGERFHHLLVYTRVDRRTHLLTPTGGDADENFLLMYVEATASVNASRVDCTYLTSRVMCDWRWNISDWDTSHYTLKKKRLTFIIYLFVCSFVRLLVCFRIGLLAHCRTWRRTWREHVTVCIHHWSVSSRSCCRGIDQNAAFRFLRYNKIANENQWFDLSFHKVSSKWQHQHHTCCDNTRCRAHPMSQQSTITNNTHMIPIIKKMHHHPFKDTSPRVYLFLTYLISLKYKLSAWYWTLLLIVKIILNEVFQIIYFAY